MSDRDGADHVARAAYLAFADEHRATCQARFSMPTVLPFATADTLAPLRAGFEALSDVIARAGGPSRLQLRTELA